MHLTITNELVNLLDKLIRFRRSIHRDNYIYFQTKECYL